MGLRTHLRRSAVTTIVTALSATLLTPSAQAAYSETINLEIRTTDNIQVASTAAGTQLVAAMWINSTAATDPAAYRDVTLTFAPDAAGSLPTNTPLQLRGGYQRCLGSACTDNFYGLTAVSAQESGTFTLTYLTKTSTIAQSWHLDIWTPQTRTISDQPDAYRGYQVQAVYVVPFDGVDRGRDVTGQISTWLMQGSRLLDTQTGDHWQVDTRVDGTPDVLFWQSAYPQAELLNADHRGYDILTEELLAKKPTTGSRKTYLFFIEGPRVGTDTSLTCGYTYTGRRAVMIVTGQNDDTCQRARPGIDFPAYTAVHETLHTLGVQHVESPSDLMSPTNGSGPVLMDRTREYYRGSNAAGVDILKLRIWAMNPQDPNRTWNCLTQGYGASSWYACATTPSAIAPTQALCWTNISTAAKLQRYDNGTWTTVVKTMKGYRSAACTTANPYTYRSTVSAKTPGLAKYRIQRGRWTSRTFTVAFQY